MQRLNCWEITGCSWKHCAAYAHPEKLCWHEPQTRCNDAVKGLREKTEACLKCELFREVLKEGSFEESSPHFLHLIEERRFGGAFADELSKELSQVYLMLAKLAIGDASARVPEGEETGMLYGVRVLLNRLARRMGEMVADSHEMAFGLCEHYEALNRIARGELCARASEGSRNPLVAKLGVLINSEAATLTRNIEELERAREELVERNQFLQVLSETVPSPIYSKDTQGRYLDCNRAFTSSLGVAREQIVGKKVHEVWPEPLAERYRKMDEELFSTGKVQVFEGSVRQADGRMRDVIFRKALFKGKDGKTAGLVGVVLDITRRKATEKAIRNAYRRIADILEFLPDPTFVVDGSKRIIAWNRAIEELTGVEKAEMLRRGDRAYALPFYGEPKDLLIDHLEAAEADLELAYAELERKGEVLSGFSQVANFRGKEARIFKETAAPLYNTQGERVGGIQTIRDVTEMVQAHREKVALKTQKAQAKAMEALLLQLGHDLKTPLTPLFALLPLARKMASDTTLALMLEICQKSAEQIQGLTKKALDLARLSSEASRPVLARTALSRLAESSLDGCGETLCAREIACLNAIPSDLYVLGAPEQLALLFDNLLSNAFRYASRSVRLAAAPKGEQVVVSVSDDGAGLEPGQGALIFDPFFKTDGSRHDLDTQGLGLAICRQVVTNHGGKIWAESDGPGRGTTVSFTLSLPC